LLRLGNYPQRLRAGARHGLSQVEQRRIFALAEVLRAPSSAAAATRDSARRKFSRESGEHAIWINPMVNFRCILRSVYKFERYAQQRSAAEPQPNAT
jgi:hypothetical protein